jgi:TetR/AcrR family transcriptional repressor of nem operon
MATAAAHEPSDARESILQVGQQIMSRKGFSAVGLTEILTTAGVPKGSFYHYFDSKEAFGEALLQSYFQSYLAELDQTLSQPRLNMAQRLMSYWKAWRENQSVLECQGKCLAVKLGAEVADLSEPMRLALKQGIAGITARLSQAIEAGLAEGSLSVNDSPARIAQSLYQLWLGASVLAKISRNTQPFDSALVTTRQMLHLKP